MEVSFDHTWLYQDPIAEINALKRQLILEGTELYDLSMVNPDIAPSSLIIDSLHSSVLKGINHRYSVSRGIKKLRDAFQKKYQKQFDVTLDCEREICVVSGTKDALIHTLHSFSSAGDTVLVGAPTYPMYLSQMSLARVKPAFFQITSDKVKLLDNISNALDESNAKILILNFPNNPTGIAVDKDFYISLAKITVQRGVTVFNDFVYGEMTNRSTQVSLLTARGINPLMIESYSLSKAYCIPGWRIGALLGAESIVRTVARLKSHTDYGIFLPLQHAAATALTLDIDIVSPVVGTYHRRLLVLKEGLSKLGWSIFESQAAGPYIWTKLPEQFQSEGATSFAKKILEKYQLLATPGELYGPEFKDYVRFAVVVSEEKLHEVINRLQAFQKEYGH